MILKQLMNLTKGKWENGKCKKKKSDKGIIGSTSTITAQDLECVTGEWEGMKQIACLSCDHPYTGPQIRVLKHE